jgi:NAD(P)-dependent dehydrogenase (short-subunit alcohol dehydrogenase family)
MGAAVSRRLGQEGGTIVVADQVDATAEKVRDELREFGADAMTFIGDLSKPENCQALMARTKEAYGRIDVLINIIGGAIWWRTYPYFEPDMIVAELNKSLMPTMWLCWAALPHMIEQRSGSIVNVSTHAIVGKFRAPYAAAKGGVMALTHCLAKEMGQYGIRINCMAPNSGVYQDRVTPRDYGIGVSPTKELPKEEQNVLQIHNQERSAEIPLGRRALGEENAAAIAFLASDDASYITGQVLPVNGGMTYIF